VAYAVKEMYLTLQGEGFHTGRAAVFCRFSGCNLWSGLESGRANAVCSFCDTDFVGVDGPGGGRFDVNGLADAIAERWGERSGTPFVVFTGGEPLLQLDAELVRAMHDRGFEIAIETNGTKPAPEGIDWICVSPKAGAELVLRHGHELKLVFPQTKLMPDQLGEMQFAHRYLQPMDGPDVQANTRAAIAYCLEHPEWRLSLQTHKTLGID